MSSSQYLISVVVPIYNAEAYLDSCLKSLTEQTYSNIELILINDGSTDGSKDICEKYKQKDKRITLVNQTNRGPSTARNKGISTATGRCILFVDSDDVVAGDYIERLHSIQIESGSLVVCCGTVGFTETPNFRTSPLTSGHIPLSSASAIDELLYRGLVSNGSYAKLIDRSLLADNAIKFQDGINTAEDIDFNYRLLKLTDHVAITTYSGYGYRYTPEGLSNGPFNPSKMDYLKVTQSILDDCRRRNQNVRSALARYVASATRLTALMSMGDTTDQEEYQRCFLIIRDNALNILLDSKVDTPTKLHAAACLMGRSVYTVLLKLKQRRGGQT